MTRPTRIQQLQRECEDLKTRTEAAKRAHKAHTFLEWRHIQAKKKLLDAEERQERKEQRSAVA